MFEVVSSMKDSAAVDVPPTNGTQPSSKEILTGPVIGSNFSTADDPHTIAILVSLVAGTRLAKTELSDRCIITNHNAAACRCGDTSIYN